MKKSVAGIAVGFVLGVATSDLIKSFVDNIIMPFITPFVAGGWESATLRIGPIVLGIGPFISALIQFFLLLLVVFIVVKKLFKK